MFRNLFAILLLLPFLATRPGAQALAAERVALIIGNSAYSHTTALPNPRNDAEAMEKALQGAGFEVLKGVDLNRSAFEKLVRRFSKALRKADIGLFFYAGHGLQVNGRNYLVPIDAALEDEADLEFAMIELKKILLQMQRNTSTNLVFIDACRDNPLARNLARAMGLSRSASIGRGMAPVKAHIGTMIAYATQPDNVALDGEGVNSPFTAALLKHIDEPGVDISEMMRRVRREVIRVTLGRQVPWDHSSLTEGFRFRKDTDGGAVSKAPDNKAQAAYRAVKSAPSCKAYKSYIEFYPKSFYAFLARQWIVENCQAKIAARPGLTDPRRGKTPLFEGSWSGEYCTKNRRSRSPICNPRMVLIENGRLVSRWGIAGKPRSGEIAGDIAPDGSVSLRFNGLSGRKGIVGKPYNGNLTGRYKRGRIVAHGALEAGPSATLTLRPADNVRLPDAVTTGSPADETLARSLQTELKRLGCYRGAIDGDWGPGSKQALRSYQRRTGLASSSDLPGKAILDDVSARSGRVCAIVPPSDRNAGKKQTTGKKRAASKKRTTSNKRPSKTCRRETRTECKRRVCPGGGCVSLRGSGLCKPGNRRTICR